MRARSAALLAAVVVVLALAGVPAQSASASTVRCGLDGRYKVNRLGYGSYIFTIRNCHPYYVERKLDFEGTADNGKCYRLPAGVVVRGSTLIWPGKSVRRVLKRC
jgi:hypothetical protein